MQDEFLENEIEIVIKRIEYISGQIQEVADQIAQRGLLNPTGADVSDLGVVIEGLRNIHKQLIDRWDELTKQRNAKD